MRIFYDRFHIGTSVKLGTTRARWARPTCQRGAPHGEEWAWQLKYPHKLGREHKAHFEYTHTAESRNGQRRGETFRPYFEIQELPKKGNFISTGSTWHSRWAITS